MRIDHKEENIFSSLVASMYVQVPASGIFQPNQYLLFVVNIAN